MLARERQAGRPRRRTPQIFWKYVGIIVLLVSGALVTSSLVELYFTNVQIRESRGELLRQEASDAAGRIDQFVLDIHRQIEWALQPVPLAGSEAEHERLVGYLSLLRLVPSITELSHLDEAGIERLRVSRLTMNVVDSGIDFSRDDRFVRPAAEPYFSAMYLRDRYEPYMTIAVRGRGARQGVTVAEVNLTYVRDVIDRIKIGQTGRAFVVDEQGQLVAHHDINLMYQRLNLSSCPQVAAALGREPGAAPGLPRDACRPEALSAHATIEPLRWSVIAEQPEQEALAPLYGSVVRTAILLLCGLILSALASLLLARAMVRPIRALQQGAARIGAGDLEQRIDLQTGDELEALAAEFNRMSAQLREERATLEQQVKERTAELTEALGERDESLKRQTAISEVLRIIAGSPSDRQAVLEAVAEKAASLCEADGSSIWLRKGDALRRVAGYGTFAPEVGVGRPISRDWITGRAAAEVNTINEPDLSASGAAKYAQSERVEIGHLSALSTPIQRDGEAVGVISIGREQAKPFTDDQIGMLETFADQIVIALELTRLFEELAQRIHELRGLSDVSQAVSSTLDFEAVLPTIVEHAVQLSGADGGAIYELDESTGEFRLRSTSTSQPGLTEKLADAPIGLGEGAVGRAAQERAAVQIVDIAEAGSYAGRLREELIAAGMRSLLAVPLLVENRVIGGLVVARRQPGLFPPAVTELLQAFAGQSALAMQNARLFGELEDTSAELKIASQRKTRFLANMSHELRDPLNVIVNHTRNVLEGYVPEQEVPDRLTRVLNASHHLMGLINEVLDLTKIEAAHMTSR